MDAGVPIIPIVIDGSFEALPASGVLRQDRVLPIRVRICEPVDTKAYSDLQALSDAVRARMLETQKELWKLRGPIPNELAARAVTPRSV